MKIKELIEILKKYDGELEIMKYCAKGMDDYIDFIDWEWWSKEDDHELIYCHLCNESKVRFCENHKHLDKFIII